MKLHFLFFAILFLQIIPLSAYAQSIEDLLPEDSTSLKNVREVDFITLSDEDFPDSMHLADPAVIHDQEEHCDCGYAVIAHARSILLAEVGKICEKSVKPTEFSYKYLKHLLNTGKPCCYDFPSCCPSRISDGLRIVVKNGITTAQEWPNDLLCHKSQDVTDAQSYQIDSFSQIRKTPDKKKDIRNLKSAIANRNPVIIGLYIPESLRNAKGQKYWRYSRDEKNFSYHAMVITGYSLSHFHLLNSYGTSWGEGGSVWVSNEDFMKLYANGQSIAFIMDWHCP